MIDSLVTGALTASLLCMLGCQPPCEERCAATQRRCSNGAENAAICAEQCTIVRCVDCFRCLEEESACPGDTACSQRCLGCARTAP